MAIKVMTKKIHLTFDDGPHPSNTPKVLDILSLHGITATFFVLGERLAAAGNLTARAVAEGHRVGNHSFDHERLSALSEAQIYAEIKNTEVALSKYIPIDRIMRPPYGAHNATVDKVLQSLGYRTVMWSVDTEDWKRKPDAWVEYGLQQIRRRETSIVLMHDIHKTTVDHLDTFIKGILALGDVEFVNLQAVTNIPPPASSDSGNGHSGNVDSGSAA